MPLVCISSKLSADHGLRQSLIQFDIRVPVLPIIVIQYRFQSKFDLENAEHRTVILSHLFASLPEILIQIGHQVVHVCVLKEKTSSCLLLFCSTDNHDGDLLLKSMLNPFC